MSCWLCGRNGRKDPLDKHHIFGGALRNKSERYGLTVELCHERCHLYGPKAAHNNAATMRKIKEYGQRKAMAENGWTVEDFIREFGKNYLPPSVACGDSSPGGGAKILRCAQDDSGGGVKGLREYFTVTEAAVLPF